MEDDNAVLNQILRRLDVLISLAFEKSVESNSISLAGKIKRMAEFGLTVSEIASVISKPANYVTATLSQQKKSAERKKGKKND